MPLVLLHAAFLAIAGLPACSVRRVALTSSRTPRLVGLMHTSEEPSYRILKGRRVPVDSDLPVDRNFQGECLDTAIDPKAAAVAFAVTAIIAAFGFRTQSNIKEGPGAPTRRAATWLALQTGAALQLGPQLTNPCSNINEKYRTE